jgi:hypothetical protein
VVFGLIDSGELNPKRPGVGQIRGKRRNQAMATDDQVRAALYLHDGDVTRAATALGYTSDGLRTRIRATDLRGQLDECLERAVDAAMSVLWDVMKSEHIGVRLSAAKEFLRTDAARRRGFAYREGNLSVGCSTQSPNVVVAWLDEDPEPKNEPGLIEGERSGTNHRRSQGVEDLFGFIRVPTFGLIAYATRRATRKRDGCAARSANKC